MDHVQSIAGRVLEWGSIQPDKTALTDGKSSMSYGELAKNILCAARTLSENYGLQPGDRLAVAADKHLFFPPLYFGCHMLGVTVLPLAPDTNPRRLEFICGQTRPALAIGFDRTLLPALGQTRHLSWEEIQDALAANSPLEQVKAPDQTQVADILFTTGTTGQPKGVPLTQANIWAAAGNINGYIQNQSVDTEIMVLPLSHSFGLGRMRCALSNGQKLVLLGSLASVKRFFRLLEQEEAHGFGIVPAGWAWLQKASGDRLGDFAGQLRYVELGSSPMPIEEKQKLAALLPHTRICMHYGLTEASRSAFLDFHRDGSDLGSLGRATPGMDIRLLDEDGQPVPEGEAGEICVSGKAVMGGYYALQPEENARHYFGKYFRTGDMAVSRPGAYLYMVSRKKEMINVGGKKVSPLEVEEALARQAGVEDCACVAMEDPEGILGEVVKAFIVPTPGATLDFGQLSAALARDLEFYKIPAAYALLDSIPKTASGKVQRLSLRQ